MAFLYTRWMSLLLGICFSGLFAWGQVSEDFVLLEWPVLAQVKYKSYQTQGMAQGEKPTPGAVVQRLNGNIVQLKGYVIPLDVDGNSFMLSAVPNESCFFCGKAGMESVMELHLRPGNRKFNMDEIATFRGRLLLNDDPYGLMYIMEGAEEVE